jgi:hypothetical protein
MRCRVNFLEGENAVSDGNVAPDRPARQEPHQSSIQTQSLNPESRRLFLSANLYVLMKKARRGARIERREVANLLPYAELDSGSGATA